MFKILDKENYFYLTMKRYRYHTTGYDKNFWNFIVSYLFIDYEIWCNQLAAVCQIFRLLEAAKEFLRSYLIKYSEGLYTQQEIINTYTTKHQVWHGYKNTKKNLVINWKIDL